MRQITKMLAAACVAFAPTLASGPAAGQDVPAPPPVPNGQWNAQVPGQGGATNMQVKVTMGFVKVTERDANGKPTKTHRVSASFNFGRGTTAPSVAFQMKSLLDDELKKEPGIAITIEREVGLPDIFIKGGALQSIFASSDSDQIRVNMGGTAAPRGGSFFIELEVLGGNKMREGSVTLGAVGLEARAGPAPDPSNLAIGQPIRTAIASFRFAKDLPGQQVVDGLESHLTAVGWSVERKSPTRIRLNKMPGSVNIAGLFLHVDGDSDYLWEILFIEE